MAATWHDAEDRASSGGDQRSPRAGASPSDLPDDPDRAITELYAAHWHRLVRLAWLLLHDQGAAEDAVQDAFVATHRNWRSIRQTGGAVGYLQTAVVNTCRSVQRHQVVVDRHQSREAGAAELPGRRSADSAETQVLHAAERGAMIEALRGLPARQREVLVLRYYADLSEAQIAEALGIAPGSVKAHAHRGLSSLRQGMPRRDPQQPVNPEVEQS
ncbi:SigE family RNA polymerase sigma factor [Intrasporangium sp.]|uniref:SigE family RNA polymerase sigma factor n=1 Tax=Intrasporangium sp. TaxID=1925024 RepID=UPI003365805A